MFFLIKKKFKVALQYLFNVVILLKTVYKLNLKLKLDLKTCTFENLEEISQIPMATLLCNNKFLFSNIIYIAMLLFEMIFKKAQFSAVNQIMYLLNRKCLTIATINNFFCFKTNNYSIILRYIYFH